MFVSIQHHKTVLFALTVIILLQACSAYRPVSTPIDSIASYEEVYLVQYQEKYRLYNIEDTEFDIRADAYPISIKDTTQKHNNLLIYSNKATIIVSHQDYNMIEIPKNSIYKCKLLIYDQQYLKTNIINSVVIISIISLVIYVLLQDVPRGPYGFSM